MYNFSITFVIFSAYETLGNPLKKRSYDSIDPLFDDDIPSVNTESKEKFLEIFTPVFERNARYVTTKNKQSLVFCTRKHLRQREIF